MKKKNARAVKMFAKAFFGPFIEEPEIIWWSIAADTSGIPCKEKPEKEDTMKNKTKNKQNSK